MIKIPHIPVQHLGDIHVGRLHGRVLELPGSPKATRTPIVLIYGHHSSLERTYSTAQALSEFGPVTVPDLPGFGGMMTLQSAGKAPTIDNLADYMADFLRQRFSRGQKVTIVGMSLGFVVATRMLQRHPELSGRIVHLVSLVGFAHWRDFGFTPGRMRLFRHTAKTMAKTPTAHFFRHVLLHRPIIGSIYHLRARSHPKMKGYSWKERQNLIDFEVTLWQTNEAKTYFSTGYEMLTLDLTSQKIPIPVEHVAVAKDQYFDNVQVIKHFSQIFTKVRVHEANLPNHAPTVIEGVEDAGQFFPPSLCTVLRTPR